MEVIVDTCVLISALMDEPNSGYCWEVLKLIRTKHITPITCEHLSREYICAPQKIARFKIKDNIHKIKNPEVLCEEVFESLYDISKDMVQIISYGRNVEVVSKLKACVMDEKDNKLVDLAHDADCEVIITQNLQHLGPINNKKIRTSKSKLLIKVYTPEEFYVYYNSKQWAKSLKP